MTTTIRYLESTAVTVTIPAAYETSYPATRISSSAETATAPIVNIVTVVPVAKYPETGTGSANKTSTAAGYATQASSTGGYLPSPTPFQGGASAMGISLWLAGAAMGLSVLL
jgi:hypothetical protein